MAALFSLTGVVSIRTYRACEAQVGQSLYTAMNAGGWPDTPVQCQRICARFKWPSVARTMRC
eukprot:321997-Pyramimonas_sp.AAC.1